MFCLFVLLRVIKILYNFMEKQDGRNYSRDIVLYISDYRNYILKTNIHFVKEKQEGVLMIFFCLFHIPCT